MNLKLRKLDITEHGRTRALWEEVFSEDTKAFLDYYYFLKTRDNEIYVLEEDEIKSMIHLNPYPIKLNDKVHQLHYIVAVATKEECRKQGFMRTLLCRSMEEMFARKEPFTFLMPAAEAIYAPYDFRYVYSQNRCKLPVNETGTEICDREAGIGDASEMAAFFQEHGVNNDCVCVYKDASYFQNKIFEQQSESGGIRILKQNNKIVCMYAYDMEEGLEVTEPYVTPGNEDAFVQSVFELAGKKTCEVPVIGFHAKDSLFCSREIVCKQAPLIMARIIHLQTFLEQLHVKPGEDFCCSFAVIDMYLQNNSRVWNLKSDSDRTGSVLVTESEDSEGVFPIAALTQFLFGILPIDDLANEQGVFLSAHLKEELHKIERLTPVFINEVV